MLKLGTPVLSEQVSIYSDYKMIGYTFYRVYKLRVATFIYQRPDNKKVIVEMDGQLAYDDPHRVYVLHQSSIDLFKQKIADIFKQELCNLKKDKEELLTKAERYQSEISEMDEQINLLRQRELTEGRLKQIKDLSKHQRRLKNRINAIRMLVSQKEEQMEKINFEMKLSLEMVDDQMKNFGKGG